MSNKGKQGDEKLEEDNLSYLLRRAAEERKQAAGAGPLSERIAREALADAYDRRARERAKLRRDDAV